MHWAARVSTAVVRLIDLLDEVVKAPSALKKVC